MSPDRFRPSLLDYNSPVTKGQRVAKIDPATFQVKVLSADAALANARAKVLKSRADLELKKLTLQRNRELRERNLIAQNDLDTAKSDYDQAVAQLALDQAAVQQAEASLQEARINLAFTDILSPVDGVVVSRNVDVGQTVAASFQTPTLFLIAQDLTKMQVDSNVSESDIGEVRVGQPASFTVDAYPGEAFHGAVVQVRNAPTTVQNVVTYDVVVGVDNPQLKLKPGMTATVNIVTAQRDDVVRIPVRALRFNPERKKAVRHTTPRLRWRTARHAEGVDRGSRRQAAPRRGASRRAQRSVCGAALRRNCTPATSWRWRSVASSSKSPHSRRHLPAGVSGESCPTRSSRCATCGRSTSSATSRCKRCAAYQWTSRPVSLWPSWGRRARASRRS